MSVWSNIVASTLTYSIGVAVGVFALDGGCNKADKAKQKMLENATPITNKVFFNTVTPEGDTVKSERLDTVAYRVPADQFKP